MDEFEEGMANALFNNHDKVEQAVHEICFTLSNACGQTEDNAADSGTKRRRKQKPANDGWDWETWSARLVIGGAWALLLFLFIRYFRAADDSSSVRANAVSAAKDDAKKD